MSKNTVPPPAASARLPVAAPSHSVRPGSLKCTCTSMTPENTRSPAASISSRPPGASTDTSLIALSSIAGIGPLESARCNERSPTDHDIAHACVPARLSMNASPAPSAATTSLSMTVSSGWWLMPPGLRRKRIATGIRPARIIASCPAPLSIRWIGEALCRNGALERSHRKRYSSPRMADRDARRTARSTPGARQSAAQSAEGSRPPLLEHHPRHDEHQGWPHRRPRRRSRRLAVREGVRPSPPVRAFAERGPRRRRSIGRTGDGVPSRVHRRCSRMIRRPGECHGGAGSVRRWRSRCQRGTARPSSTGPCSMWNSR